MSKADKMFEELGYEKILENNYGVVYKKGIGYIKDKKTSKCIELMRRDVRVWTAFTSKNR